MDLHNLKDGFHLFSMEKAIDLLPEIYENIENWNEEKLCTLLNKLASFLKEYDQVCPKAISAHKAIDQLFKQVTQNQRIQIHIQGDNPEINFRNYPNLLHCLAQLMINSVDHGLIPKLKISPDFEGKLWVECSFRNGFYTLNIMDNGVGLSTKSEKEGFSYSGDGLGISSCQKIIKELGGTISFSEHQEEGTIVVVTIPEKTLQKVA